jgi:hypothetical protein
VWVATSIPTSNIHNFSGSGDCSQSKKVKNHWFYFLQLFLYVYACIIYKVTKETIVNCWKKSGLIDNNQSNEELNNNVEKERSKEKEELDELLKFIGREAFF